MRVLCLDASTSAGWALMEGEPGDALPKILERGLVKNERTIAEYGEYPWNYLGSASDVADRLFGLVKHFQPDVIVIEETNLGRARYTQKILEFIHCRLLGEMAGWSPRWKVMYISSSAWRKRLDIKLDAAQRRNNAKLAKAKALARAGSLTLSQAKKKLGVGGKITKKHLAVWHVNDLYQLDLKQKDNDQADAICLGLAYFLGVEPADGII